MRLTIRGLLARGRDFVWGSIPCEFGCSCRQKALRFWVLPMGNQERKFRLRDIVNTLAQPSRTKRAYAVLVLWATTAIALPAQTLATLYSFHGREVRLGEVFAECAENTEFKS